MQITLTLNGRRVTDEVAPDLLLLDFVRAHGCASVKRGCETANCGLCTVLLDGSAWLTVLALSFAPVVVCELRKALNRKKM